MSYITYEQVLAITNMSIIEILQLASQGISPDEIVEMYECYIDGIMQDIEGGINQRSSTW